MLPTPPKNQTTNLDISNLHAQSTAILKEQLATAVQLTADHLTYIAAIWQELERRGEDMSALRHGLMHYIPMIAGHKLDPRAVINYAGQKTLLSSLAALPIETQRNLIDTGTVDIIEIDGNGEQIVIPTRLEDLTAAQTYQAFTSGRLLTPAEQYKVLMVRHQTKPKKQSKPYRMTSNLKIDGKTLIISNKIGVDTDKLIQILKDNNLIQR